MWKFLCGGTAGCLTWFVCFPLDTVKAKMQSHAGLDRLRWHRVLMETVYMHGLKRLYRGVHVQMLRAFPSNAASLLVYETIKNTL
jgi:hypothetical protein